MEINCENENGFSIISTEQVNDFRNELMIAVYKQLYTNGFISDVQLRQLLSLHGR